MKSTKLAVAALILSRTWLQAANVKVHCGGKGQFTSISSALKTLDPSQSNTVTVRGKRRENVLIHGFDRLTLISTTGSHIQDASKSTSLVVDIEDSRRVTLQGFTVTRRLGVQRATSSVCYLTGNTVQSSMGDGVGVFSACMALARRLKTTAATVTRALLVERIRPCVSIPAQSAAMSLMVFFLGDPLK